MYIRLFLLLASFYLILNSLASAAVRCAAMANCSVSPSFLASLVYLAIFGFLGAPIVMGTVMWQSRWHTDL